jgi:hypothetical protein
MTTSFFSYSTFLKFFLLAIFFTSVVLGRTAVAISVIIRIGIKFGYRELHFSEDRAGIVVVAGFAVVFGQAETARGKHELDAAFHTNNREHTDRNVNVVYADAVNKATVEAHTDLFGN